MSPNLDASFSCTFLSSGSNCCINSLYLYIFTKLTNLLFCIIKCFNVTWWYSWPCPLISYQWQRINFINEFTLSSCWFDFMYYMVRLLLSLILLHCTGIIVWERWWNHLEWVFNRQFHIILRWGCCKLTDDVCFQIMRHLSPSAQKTYFQEVFRLSGHFDTWEAKLAGYGSRSGYGKSFRR